MCCEGCRSWSALRILSLHPLLFPPLCLVPLSTLFNLDMAAAKPPIPLVQPWPYSNLTHVKTADTEPERRGRVIPCMLIGTAGAERTDGEGLRWGSDGAAGNLEG